MGVAGSGKTTIGELLATKLQIGFFDADNFHSAANIAKMAAGEALTDDDRKPWLDSLARNIVLWKEDNTGAVLACSALKSEYRDIILEAAAERVDFVYLKGDFELIKERLHSRSGHFMKESMLKSQFETLEEPGLALIVDISLPPEQIVQKIIEGLPSLQATTQ